MLFYGFLIGSADPLRKMSDIFTRLQRAAAASDRIFTLLDRQPTIRDPQHPRPLGRHAKDLVFEGVEFAYTPGRPVLRDINLRIGFGETIGVVGPSGCGKSTLANLIPRFADPTSGSIRLDGIPLGEVRVRALRSQVGLVTQEPLLFDDTVMNNIRYGLPRATEEQVIAAAKQAHAHWFIEHELKDAYETSLGPMGGQLSGGQRQRIALARAILRDPALLILDEATSQIDLESEQIIQKVLARFTEGRTTVIVTHRLGLLALRIASWSCRTAASSTWAATTTSCGVASSTTGSTRSSSPISRRRREGGEEMAAGVIVGDGGDLLGRSGGHHLAAALPPSGPRSMIQSADLITSRWCSMTITVLPRSTSRRARPGACGCRRSAGRWSARRGCRASAGVQAAEFRGQLDPLGLAAGERG